MSIMGSNDSHIQRIPICVEFTLTIKFVIPGSILKSFTATLFVSESSILSRPNHDTNEKTKSAIPKTKYCIGINKLFTEHFKNMTILPCII